MRYLKPVMIGGPVRIWDLHSLNCETLFKQTGNTGNLAFRYAVYKLIGRSAPVLPWSTDPRNLPGLGGEIAIMPCSNQIGPHANCSGRLHFTKALEIPALALGLGAQAKDFSLRPEIPEDTIGWIREISSRSHRSAPNIGVRGHYTARVLADLGFGDHIRVLGCPSLFINDNPNLGLTIAKKVASNPQKLCIGVAAGNPMRPASVALERALIALSINSGGAYVVQHPLSLIKAARGEEASVPPQHLTRFQNLYKPNGADRGVVPVNSTVFFDIDSWMESLRRHHLIVGMRIHGIMLAIQAGIPALCITHDSRTQELCEVMMIPHISVQELDACLIDLTPEFLLDTFTKVFDPNAFDANRKKLAAATVSLMKDSLVSPPSYMLKFV